MSNRRTFNDPRLRPIRINTAPVDCQRMFDQELAKLPVYAGMSINTDGNSVLIIFYFFHFFDLIMESSLMLLMTNPLAGAFGRMTLVRLSF